VRGVADRSLGRMVISLAIALAIGLGLAACTGGGFPATSACPEEPREAGVLPALEALLPTELSGRAADALDSGWNCLSTTLGTYASHGVTRLEFAGATWDDGNGNGAVAAVFKTSTADPPLQAGWVEEFYEQGARAARGVENVETSIARIDGVEGDGWRLDALNNLSLQTIIVWPHGDHVHIVLVASTVEPGASRDAHVGRVIDLVLAASSVAGDDAAPPAMPAASPPSSAPMGAASSP
jgi:hypothetical protein